ncbi:MAG: GTP-binding protein [Promethearchaeota archaeon]
MLKFKIIVAGAKAVGKTSLIRRYVTGKFSIDTLSTIGVDFMTKNVNVKGKEIHFSIWDFAGEGRFRQLFPSYMSGASASLILFDITNRETFEELKEWLELINKSAPEMVKILVAAKIDLADQRKVSKEEAEQFMADNKLDYYIETSAKAGLGVEETFLKMGELILNKTLIECPECGKLVPKGQLFCLYCGAKISPK